MYESARALTEAGHDVTVVTEFPNHPVGLIPPRYAGRWFEDDRSHLFRHPEIRKDMGERGRQFVTRHYRRRLQAQRFADVVADAAGGRAQRR